MKKFMIKCYHIILLKNCNLFIIIIYYIKLFLILLIIFSKLNLNFFICLKYFFLKKKNRYITVNNSLDVLEIINQQLQNLKTL